MLMLSIVIPIYNTKEYAKKCVLSVMNQTFKDYECIIVDDGSIDDGYEVCKDLVKDDKRFKVFRKENGGLADARNYGMNLAQGKYIFFLDGDDSLYENAMEKCINKLEETQSDIVIFDVEQISLLRNTSEIIKNKFDENKMYSLDTNKEILVNVLNAAWNKMYRKDLFTNNNIKYPFGYYYEDLGTTYKLILKANKISFINEPLYKYIVDRPGNITQKFNSNAFDVMDMVDENIKYFKENNVFDKYYEELKFLSNINLLETLKKTRNVRYDRNVKIFIDKIFDFSYKNFGGFKSSKYNLLREKNNYIYTNKLLLKIYLNIKNIIRK